jgi:hypothetical protein
MALKSKHLFPHGFGKVNLDEKNHGRVETSKKIKIKSQIERPGGAAAFPRGGMKLKPAKKPTGTPYPKTCLTIYVYRSKVKKKRTPLGDVVSIDKARKVRIREGRSIARCVYYLFSAVCCHQAEQERGVPISLLLSRGLRAVKRELALVS